MKTIRLCRDRAASRSSCRLVVWNVIAARSRFQRAGLSPAAISLLGGGATQFSIAGGNPEADVKQWDVSFYLQDEWKVRPNFTFSPGLRYENQNNIDSDFDFAPRIAFAWSPVFGKKKAPAAAVEAKPATTGNRRNS